MNLYLQHVAVRADGTRDSFCTEAVEARESPLWWQLQGLQQTASGYGRKLTTTRMVRYLGRWHRVYVACWSNNGTAYIIARGERITVTD